MANFHQLRRVQCTTVLAVILAISVSAFGTYKALTSTSATAAVATARAIQTGDIQDSARGAVSPEASEHLLTKTGPQFQTSLIPIEELQVGQRVCAEAPTEDVDRQFGDEVVSSQWRKLTLTAPKRDGTVADVVLLRPRWWIEQQKAEVDGQVLISVPECGINGDATVHSIGPCPEIVSGPGRVITGTFRHRVSSGIELSVEGEDEPIRCTGNHPFWSEDRQGFVRADSLKQRETLRITTGLAAVVSSRPLPGDTFVYNIEVHRTHVYHVGRTGTLVHNGNGLPILNPCFVPKGEAGSELVSIWRAARKGDGAEELIDGFKGKKRYFGKDEWIGEAYSAPGIGTHENFMTEVRVPRDVYNKYFKQFEQSYVGSDRLGALRTGTELAIPEPFLELLNLLGERHIKY